MERAVRKHQSTHQRWLWPGPELTKHQSRKNHCIRANSTTTGLINMSEEDGGGGGFYNQSAKVIRTPEVPTLPQLRDMRGSRSLSPENRSFSSPSKMDVDTVWQWSMRLWFLIIAVEDADGHALGHWERMETGGSIYRESVASPHRVHLWPCGDDDLYFPPWWFISCLPQKTPSSPRPPYLHQTHACCYGDICGPRWGRKDNSGHRRDTEDVLLTHRLTTLNKEGRKHWSGI